MLVCFYICLLFCILYSKLLKLEGSYFKQYISGLWGINCSSGLHLFMPIIKSKIHIVWNLVVDWGRFYHKEHLIDFTIKSICLIVICLIDVTYLSLSSITLQGLSQEICMCNFTNMLQTFAYDHTSWFCTNLCLISLLGLGIAMQYCVKWHD